jgi:hypothetical protein
MLDAIPDNVNDCRTILPVAEEGQSRDCWREIVGAGVRLGLILIAFMLAVALIPRLLGSIKLPRRSQARPSRPAVVYDWERRTDRYSRKLKRVKAPEEDRDAILQFIESRTGVEAYVEPKTVVSPLSVVLVAADGEWRRFNLADDAYIRELAATRNLKVFDAVRVGYPKRMREYRPGKKPSDEPN